MNDTHHEIADMNDRDAPGNTVSVEISEIWVRRLTSPLYFVVATLTGVSITFAPLFLLMLGIQNQWNVFTISQAATCFLVVYLVPLFYMRLAGEVIGQLARKKRLP